MDNRDKIIRIYVWDANVHKLFYSKGNLVVKTR